MTEIKMRCSVIMLAVSAAVALPQSVVAQNTFDSGDFFKRLDSNGDGVLTTDDMSDQRRELFNLLLQRGDNNKDGKLTREEFTASMRNRGATQPQRPSTNRPQFGGRNFGGPRGGSFGSSAPNVGDSLPDITVYDSEGKEFNLRRMRGNYSVLVFGCLT